MEVSLFASSIRPKLYQDFFDSLEGTSVKYEVVFAGDCELELINPYIGFTYIETGDIKPAQCYEIARRACIGEVVVWVADDCEFNGDIIGKAYKYWKQQNDEKLILSLQTKEADAFNGNMHLCPMEVHSFFGGRPETPLMAPIGMMSREYLQFLGGFDNRYICGQYENDIVMRAYQNGSEVQVFGDKDCNVEIDHHAKHGGPRAFHDYYPIDREVLQDSWALGAKTVSAYQLDNFEPYKNKDILTKSQGKTGHWV